MRSRSGEVLGEFKDIAEAREFARANLGIITTLYNDERT